MQTSKTRSTAGQLYDLRDYQQKSIADIRNAFRNSKRVFFVLPTGAGKTFIFSHIAKSAIKKGKNTWIVCPRNELICQSKKTVENLDCETGIIAPGHMESESNLHIVSKDTWIRRKEKIYRKPDFVIVDEGHLATNRYEEMVSEYPDAFFLFVSATPERLNGQGLHNLAPESAVVYGPSMEWLIQNRYLSEIDYYCPPISGIENIKRHGTEYDPEQLHEWIAEKKIFAKTIEQYEKYCTGKQSIVFCRNVAHSVEAAKKFCDAGYRFESIDGTMARKRIREVIEAVRNKELDGLTSCELVTYGLDVPNVKAIIMLRPTMSRALFYQMLGRGLRYTGENCVVLDQVGNAIRLCKDVPWRTPDWNYSGRKKAVRTEAELSIKFCPYIEFRPCVKKTCLGCEHNEKGEIIDRWVEIDGELVPMVDNKKLSERSDEEKRFINNMVVNLVVGDVTSGKIKELCDIAKNTKRHPLWVYNALQPKPDTINRFIIKGIRKAYEYDQGWVKRVFELKGL